MDFNEYQKEILKTLFLPVNYNGDDTKDFQNLIARITLGIGGEAGEVQEKIKKWMRDNEGIITSDFLSDITNELGDLLWYITALSELFEISIDYIAENNLKKLQSRMERRKISGSGDNR